MPSSHRPADSGDDSAREANLLRRCRSGEPDAYGELIAMHQKRLHSVAFRLTGSASDAADVAQEAFLRAWRQLDAYRGDGPFGAWLCRIAVNLALHDRARAQRREAVHQEWMEAAVHAPGSEPDSDRLERIRNALQRLEPEARAAVVLTVYEGLNHAEAARILGCAETTVSWRVWRARNRLRRWLAELAPRPGDAST